MCGSAQRRVAIKEFEKKLTPQEAAKILGLKDSTLARWRTQNDTRLPWYKIGNRVFYLEKDLFEYIKAARQAC